MASEIVVTNLSNDEAECDYFEVSLTNGNCKVTVPLYAIDGLKQFGQQLINFPRTFYDIATYEVGEGNPSDNVYFLLKAFCYNPNGHIVIQVTARSNGDSVTTYHAQFSLLCEAASVNRFGVSIKNWDHIQARRFVWSFSR